jgi:hypothetical protein
MLNSSNSIHHKYWFLRGMDIEKPQKSQDFRPGEFKRLEWIAKGYYGGPRARAFAYQPSYDEYVFVDKSTPDKIYFWKSCLPKEPPTFIQYPGSNFTDVTSNREDVFVLDAANSSVVNMSSGTNPLASQSAGRRISLQGTGNITDRSRLVMWKRKGISSVLLWTPGSNSCLRGEGTSQISLEPYDLDHEGELSPRGIVLNDDILYVSTDDRRIWRKDLQRDDRLELIAGPKLQMGPEIFELMSVGDLAVFRFYGSEINTQLQEEFEVTDQTRRIAAHRFLVITDPERDAVFTMGLDGGKPLPLLGTRFGVITQKGWEVYDLLTLSPEKANRVIVGGRGSLLFGNPDGLWKVLRPNIGVREPKLPNPSKLWGLEKCS